MSFLDWVIGGGYGFHVSSLLIHLFAGMWIVYVGLRRYHFKWDVLILWTYAVGITAGAVFEILWHFSVAFTHGGNLTLFQQVLWCILFSLQLTGIPIIAHFQRVFRISMRFDKIFLVLVMIASIIYLVWFIAPFPHEIVFSKWFPQEIYGNGIYTKNDFVRILNVTLKIVLEIVVVYLFLGDKK